MPRCLATARLLFRGRLERKARKTVSPHGPGPARAAPSLTAPGTEAFASACRVRAHRASRAHPHAFPRPATDTGPGCSSGPRGREGGGALTLVPLSPAGSKFNPALGTAGAPGSGGARTRPPSWDRQVRAPLPSGPTARKLLPALPSPGPRSREPCQGTPFTNWAPPSPCTACPPPDKHLPSVRPQGNPRQLLFGLMSAGLAPSGRPGCSKSQPPARRSPRPRAPGCGLPGPH